MEFSTLGQAEDVRSKGKELFLSLSFLKSCRINGMWDTQKMTSLTFVLSQYAKIAVLGPFARSSSRIMSGILPKFLL
jgi:hypothetical protein